MKKILNREFATSFTTILFFIISVSGLFLFFHLFEAQVKELHEILGIGFVIVALLHVVFNFASMKRYFSKKIFVFATVLGLLVSGVFVFEGMQQQGENPKTLLIQKALNAPLETSLALLSVTRETALAKLEKNQIIVKKETTISQIAKSNKTSPFRVVAILNAE